MIRLQLSSAERDLMSTLLSQYEELVASDGDDPALARLFPVAYPHDPDAAAEFRRYTRAGLVDSKSANAGAVAVDLTMGSTIDLTPESAARWLPLLTDLRLVVAERLGIRVDGDPIPDDSLGEVYHWLGALQIHLIEAIEALE